jgi:hypothetical protein
MDSLYHPVPQVQVKVKVTYNRLRKPRGGAEVQLYPFFNIGARYGGWSTPRPGHFAPGKDPVTLVYEAGWDLGSAWTGAENLDPTGVRSSDRPARSDLLYRLSYRGPKYLSLPGPHNVRGFFCNWRRILCYVTVKLLPRKPAHTHTVGSSVFETAIWRTML